MTDNDLRPELATAYGQAITVSEAVDADQLGLPTPCREMELSALLDHLVFAARRAAALGMGKAPAIEQKAPHIELAEVPGALRDAATEAAHAWGDDASLDRVLTMPWGEEYTGRALLCIYLIEIATHAWDVAAASGNLQLLDEGLGAAVLACAEASIKPEYRNDAGNPFGPEVEPPVDATSWERLAAFMGRTPR